MMKSKDQWKDHGSANDVNYIQLVHNKCFWCNTPKTYSKEDNASKKLGKFIFKTKKNLIIVVKFLFLF